MSCSSKQCNIGITKKHNGVSTKMLQAQIVKTSGTHRVSYNNSNSDNINAIILSGDYTKNKTLLLCFKYNTYIKLLEPISVKHPELITMLNNIINHLTLAEYNAVYGIIPVVVPVIIPPEIIIKKTYYVITRSMTETAKYFIFKNYSSEDAFVPTYSYKFDLEHISNTGTELSFATDKNDNEYKYLTRYGTPGDENGAYLLLTLPQDISYNKLYLYNKSEHRIYVPINTINSSYTSYDIYRLGLYRYEFWCCMLKYIGIQLDAVSINRINSCKNIPLPQIIPTIPRNYSMNINTSTTIRNLTQSSILTSINYDGVHLYIQDIYDKTSVLYYTNFTFALNIGTYYLFVPPIYKLAFLNINQTDNFNYVGRNIVISDVIGTDADGTYEFYSGTITITITGSFQPISIYTLQYGYLDAKNIMVFSDQAPLVSGIPRLINM